MRFPRLVFYPVTFSLNLIHSLKRYNASTSYWEDAGRADRVNVNNEKLLAKTPASCFSFGRAAKPPGYRAVSFPARVSTLFQLLPHRARPERIPCAYPSRNSQTSASQPCAAKIRPPRAPAVRRSHPPRLALVPARRKVRRRNAPS